MSRPEECCRLHPDRPAVTTLHTDIHEVLTRRKTGNDDIPVCAQCLARWRKTQAVKAEAVHD